jgi:group I intron endonuclease
MPFVYSIKNKIDGMEYIGQTRQDDFNIRLQGHRHNVNSGKKRHLYNSIRFHGWDNFKISILYKIDKFDGYEEELNRLEILEIKERNTLAPHGYNNETGGNLGKSDSDATKKLKSTVHSGANHHMNGKNHKQDTCKILSEKNKKPVQKWTKDCKTLLETFDSIEEASKATGADGSHIGKVCNGYKNRKTAAGFHWKFVNPDDTQQNENIEFTKIQQWSFDDKTLIEEFDTIKEASEKTGAINGRISKCLKGKSHSAGGFHWKMIV